MTSPLKTFYELSILFFSAAAIFIIVLLLATLNGDGTSADQLDLDPELMISNDYQLDRRSRDSNGSQRESSLSSSIMYALFGNFDDPDDPEYDDEEDEEPDNIMIVPTNQPPVSMAQLNMAQNRLITTMEQTTDDLEFFFDQCHNFEVDPQILPSSHFNPLLYGQQLSNGTSKPAVSHSSLDYHYSESSSPSTTNQLYRMGRPHYPLIAPPLPPPCYSNQTNISEQTSTETDKPEYDDLPPSYEEATRSDYN